MSFLTFWDVSVTIGTTKDSEFSLWSSSTCLSHVLSSLFKITVLVTLSAFLTFIFVFFSSSLRWPNTVFKYLCLITITFKLFMLWHPFFARVKVNPRRVYSHILANVCAVAMAMGLVKTRLKNGFCLLKKNPVIRFFHHLPTTNWH